MNLDFWSGRRVLVTGHTGFKGGWLTLWLRSLGAKVSGLALAPDTTPSLFESASVGQGVESHLVDINHYPPTLEVIDAVRPEVLFHLAAQPLVRRSYQHPLETLSTNILGTAHLLEALRTVGSTQAVVVVTSDKCYENREWPWGYREGEPMGGHDPYSCSKGCAELVTAAWRRSFLGAQGCSVATARAGNVHGGGDWSADRLVPDLIRAFQTGQRATIRNPHAIRPWQHVLEPLLGYLLLAERLYREGEPFAEAWNFGPDAAAERSVGEVADHLSRYWGEGASWNHQLEVEAPHEATFLKLDSSKARMRLDWQPRWGFAEGLQQSVAWYRAFAAGEAIRQVTERQIEAYLEGCNAPPPERATPTQGATP